MGFAERFLGLGHAANGRGIIALGEIECTLGFQVNDARDQAFFQKRFTHLQFFLDQSNLTIGGPSLFLQHVDFRPAFGDLPFQGEVYALYVAIDWQGKGLGRQLLGALFSQLRGTGVSDAYLWVLAGNPARFFYESMDGTRIAERQESFAGTLLDEIAYGWTDLSQLHARQDVR